MTQTSKQILTMLAFVLPVFGMVCAAIAPVRAQSVVTLIVTDPLTGIAISGYDPVSYFTEPAPLPGRADFELVWQNVPWHFASAANRDVFQRAPEVYAPQYGGHDGMGVSRGFVADSDARIYAVFKERLYLFYSAANREAFLLAPDAAARTGAEKWPELSRQLSVN
ncbi:YHS domain-containing (seleno)protein [Devosia submarina]|uniref:YHS domain-containing (seleno)protein n=1 Tax=Devosia submarina TaxID=1173082 RepID=UPI0013007996|nr:YHS domain-containing (seleno)protein [Devosia submarina]